MEKTMTPSQTITDGQIDKAGELFRSILKRHRAKMSSGAVQWVLGSNMVWLAVFEVFQGFVDAFSNIIIRRVPVNRSRTPQAMLDATSRIQDVTDYLLRTMPVGEGEEVEVVFFNPGRSINNKDLELQYEARDLKPADPYSLAAVNEADPSFADDYPNTTHWKSFFGAWCNIDFYCLHNERRVEVKDLIRRWSDGWWFAGLRK